MSGPSRDLLSFWSAFVGSPRRIGAIAPSSLALAGRMLAGVDWDQVGTAVECGPGTGPFTGPILRELRPSARLVALEIDPSLAARLRRRFPGLAVHACSVAELPRILREEGAGPADIIFSSLPWAAFPRAEQAELLAAIVASLAPGGRFVTFAYLQGLLLPSGRWFRDLLERNFADVSRSSVAWGNLPPAFAYRCRR